MHLHTVYPLALKMMLGLFSQTLECSGELLYDTVELSHSLYA
jgi:hypothetical protein